MSVGPSSESNRKLIKSWVNLCERDNHVTEYMPNSNFLVLTFVSLPIDFKNSKWLSVTWLFLFYKFNVSFIYFLFLSHEGSTLEKYRKYSDIFYISIFIRSPELWNTFSSCLKLCNSLAVFKSSHNKMYFAIKYICLQPLWLHLNWNLYFI